jgi:transposase-like protein
MNYQRRYKGLLKAKRLLRIWRLRELSEFTGFYSDHGRLAKRLLQTRKPCSCSACGNPRRYIGEKTMQERRAETLDDFFMSSSLQNAQQIKETALKAVSKTIYSCPECDKQEMRRVIGPFNLGDGSCMPNLERFHCRACGSDFFDDPAMKAIRAFRESQERKLARTSRSKKASAAVYSPAA